MEFPFGILTIVGIPSQNHKTNTTSIKFQNQPYISLLENATLTIAEILRVIHHFL
jgi:hypothetical protein